MRKHLSFSSSFFLLIAVALLVGVVEAEPQADRLSVGKLGFPVIPDRISGCGPMGGLHAALSAGRSDWNLVVACDMPAVSYELLAELLAAAEESGADALVPSTPEGWQPLCAVYHVRLLPAVEAAIHAKRLKMHDFVSSIPARFWPAPDASLFRNVNTPEQFMEIR